MSLVNDALKRAKQAQKNVPPPPVGGPAPRHVEPAGQDNASSGILWPLVIVAIVGVVGCVLWFAMRKGGTDSTNTIVVQARTASGPDRGSTSVARQDRPTPSPTITHPVAEATASTPAAATLSPISALASTPASTSPVEATKSSGPTTTQMVIVASGPPPPPPLPKLQGIVYRPDRPTALLDGRSALIGKMVGEYLVVDISQQKVTVVRAGQTNVLILPD